jgi:hypothetical protein
VNVVACIIAIVHITLSLACGEQKRQHFTGPGNRCTASGRQRTAKNDVSKKKYLAKAVTEKSLAIQFHGYHFESGRQFMFASKITRQTVPANGRI